MTARDDILGKVRAALGRTTPAQSTAGQSTAGQAVQSGSPPLPEYANDTIVPARGQGSPAECVVRFVEMAAEASVTLDRVAAAHDVPGAVAAFLTRENLPQSLVMSPDTGLDALPWATTDLDIRRGAARDGDAVSLTPTVCGIAETGTLMVRSGPATPYTLNFLPDTHIAVLYADDIIGSYEDAWARMRPNGETGPDLPRFVTLITGPSRSSDIERTVTIGVHGPCNLHVVLVGRAAGETG